MGFVVHVRGDDKPNVDTLIGHSEIDVRQLSFVKDIQRHQNSLALAQADQKLARRPSPSPCSRTTTCDFEE